MRLSVVSQQRGKSYAPCFFHSAKGLWHVCESGTPSHDSRGGEGNCVFPAKSTRGDRPPITPHTPHPPSANGRWWTALREYDLGHPWLQSIFGFCSCRIQRGSPWAGRRSAPDTGPDEAPRVCSTDGRCRGKWLRPAPLRTRSSGSSTRRERRDAIQSNQARSRRKSL